MVNGDIQLSKRCLHRKIRKSISFPHVLTTSTTKTSGLQDVNRGPVAVYTGILIGVYI